MDNIIGLIKDINAVNAPQGTKWEHAKNILVDRGFKSIRNEAGFDLKVVFDKPIIGCIPTNKGFLVCLTDNTRSDIKFINNDWSVTVIKEDSTDFGFRLDKPIEGVFKENSKGDTIVAFSDNYNPIRVLNVSNPPNPVTAESINLFPTVNGTKFSLNVVNTGGQLVAGSYVVTGKYYNNQGTESQWLHRESPITITKSTSNDSYEEFTGSPLGETTGKSINISIDHLGNQENYTNFKLAVISKIKGITTVNVVADLPISTQYSEFTYTGNETIEEITLDDVLVETSIYNKAKSLTNFNGDLVLANLQKDEIAYQKYANNIKIKCKAEAIRLDNESYTSKNDIGNRQETSFMPREVYSFYIYFRLKTGGISKYYHIPGLSATASGVNPTNSSSISNVNTGFSSLPKKYQIEDTIDAASVTNTTSSRNNDLLICNMGYWENTNETYPSDESSEIWDSSGYTSVTLATQKVRHHRFPSIRFLGNNGLGTSGSLGLYETALLGIRIEDVYIPTEIQDKITSWHIAYVKRDYNNMTVFAQDKLDYAHDYDFNTGSAGQELQTSFGLNVNFTAGSTNPNSYTVNDELCRGHAQDLLLEKPNISPDYISNEAALSRASSGSGQYLIDDAEPTTSTDRVPDRFSIDFLGRYGLIDGTLANTYPSNNNSIRAISDFQYLVNNGHYQGLQNPDAYSNVFRETCIYYKLDNPSNLLKSGSFSTISWSSGAKTYLTSYETNLISYCKLRDNVYFGYSEPKELVTINDDTLSGVVTTKDLYGGDVYLTDTCQRQTVLPSQYPYNFDKAGFKDALAVSGLSYWFYQAYVDILFVSHTAHNWGLRVYDADDPLTAFFPKVKSVNRSTDGIIGDVDFKLLYNRDFTNLNTYNQGEIFNYLNTSQNLFPYRLHIGKAYNPENDLGVNWASFLPREFYEMVSRHKGEIIKVSSYNRILFIHQKYSLFIAKIKDRFNVSTEEVFLGDADIFDRQPDELAATNDGYVGNQNQFSTIVCRLGYCFIDRQTGRVFVYNNSLKEISNIYVRQFILDNFNYESDTDNPFSEAGLTMMYDELWERLIISKIDYVPIFSYTEVNEDLTGILVSDTYFKWKGRYYKLAAGVSTVDPYTPTFLITGVEYHGRPVDLTDENLFTNNSKTMSYSPNIRNGQGGWVGLHDYYPCYMFNNREKQIAIKNSNDLADDSSGVFLMNQENKKGLYFEQTSMPIGNNTYYDSYIDFILNIAPDIPKRWSTFVFDTDIINTSSKVLETETIDKVLIYNNNQCSGEIDINVGSYIDKNIRNQHGKWYFNEFRDLVADSNVVFINDEKEVVTSNISNSKAFFDNSNFISKFVIIRLLKTNTSDNKTLIINTINSISYPIKQSK